MLVNPWNPLPENYTVQTVTLQNGLQVDERCYPDLQAMMDACRADGLNPVICSAYRTREVQESLYQQEVGRYLDEGYDQDAAEAEAGKSVAVSGTSEHQLGLAVDIVDIDHQILDESQENTEVQKWLMAHSWEYGFILRYPTGKSEITGISLLLPGVIFFHGVVHGHVGFHAITCWGKFRSRVVSLYDAIVKDKFGILGTDKQV